MGGLLASKSWRMTLELISFFCPKIISSTRFGAAEGQERQWRRLWNIPDTDAKADRAETKMADRILITRSTRRDTVLFVGNVLDYFRESKFACSRSIRGMTECE